MLWRVFCCVGVFITHLALSVGVHGSFKVITDFGGKIAVYFFFAISGYLAFSRYLPDESPVSYWKKRLLRIVPLYGILICYYFVAHTFFFKDVPTDPYRLGWLRYIFFISDDVPAQDNFWRNLGMTWTICWFMLFYLLMPLLHRVINSLRRALLFCACAYMVFFLKDMLFGEWMSALKGLFFFSVGIAVYFAVKEHKENLLIFLFAWATFFFVIQGANNELTGIVLFGILLVATGDLKLKEGSFKKTVAAIDRYSFEIYLLQGVIFNDIVWNVMSVKNITNPVAIVLVAVIGTAVCAVAIHELLRVLIYDRLRKERA